jgi:hypothetical protein
MSSPPDAFGLSRRTGPLYARTLQTYARIETAPRHSLQARLSKHELVMSIASDVPEKLRLQRIGQRILKLGLQIVPARTVASWLLGHRSSCGINHTLH